MWGEGESSEEREGISRGGRGEGSEEEEQGGRWGGRWEGGEERE